MFQGGCQCGVGSKIALGKCLRIFDLRYSIPPPPQNNARIILNNYSGRLPMWGWTEDCVGKVSDNLLSSIFDPAPQNNPIIILNNYSGRLPMSGWIEDCVGKVFRNLWSSIFDPAPQNNPIIILNDYSGRLPMWGWIEYLDGELFGSKVWLGKCLGMQVSRWMQIMGRISKGGAGQGVCACFFVDWQYPLLACTYVS